MPFPDEVLHAIPTDVASELLAWLHDVPCSHRLTAWARELNGEVDSALAQSASSLFPKGA